MLQRTGRKPNPVVDGKKQCATCGEWKPVHDFPLHGDSAADGSLKRRGDCNVCYYAFRAREAAKQERRLRRNEQSAETYARRKEKDPDYNRRLKLRRKMRELGLIHD